MNLSANEIIWARQLIKVANRQPQYSEGVIEYGQLDAVTATNLRHGARPFNEVSGEMLGNISTLCYSLNLPLISVIVVSADNNKKEPSFGFYSLLVNLGKIKKVPTNDIGKMELYVPEMKRVHEQRDWSKLENALMAISKTQEITGKKSDTRLGVMAIERKIASQEDKITINEIESNLPQSPTERVQLVKVRLQQSNFRDKLLEKYQGKCIITGLSEPTTLVAGHIKPWAVSDDNEKLDKENGLLLSATFDKLFDKGLISFSDDGKLMISKVISSETLQILQLDTNREYGIMPSKRMREYLEYHRKEIFREE